MADDLIKIALYGDKLDHRPICLALAWKTFVDFLVNYVEESPCTMAPGPRQCVGKNCPHKSASSKAPDETGRNPMGWSPVEIVNNHRLDANVRSVYLLTLDVDHLTDAAAEDARARSREYVSVVHTTHNSRPGDVGLRIVFLLSRPVAASDWHRFLRSAVAYLGIAADPTCKDRSRMYFRPSHPQGAPWYADYFDDGVILDVDEVLSWAKLNLVEERFSGSPRLPAPSEAKWDLDGEPVCEAIDLMARSFPDRRRHELCLAIAGMLRDKGATVEDARWIVREIAEQGGSTDPETRSKTVDHTWALGPDAARTAFTRVSEIVGAEVAEDFGDWLTEAASDAFLEGIRLTPDSVRLGAQEGAEGAEDGGEDAPPPLPKQTVVDIKAVRAGISDAVRKNRSRPGRDPQVTAILLQRILSGKPLASVDNKLDVETVLENEVFGVDRKKAVRMAMGALAFALDPPPAWPALFEIARASLTALHDPTSTREENWLRVAEKAYGKAVKAREVGEAKERQAEEERRRLAAARGALASDDVLTLLEKRPDGEPLSSHDNVATIFERDSTFCSHLKFNLLTKEIEVTGGVLYDYRDSEDAMVTVAQRYISRAYGLNVTRVDAESHIFRVAFENKYDPLTAFLNGLKWDGVPRISNWLKTYCCAKAENPEYLEKVSRRWFISLVARGFEPGCKVDTVLVLESLGGVGKSTVFKIIGGEWFNDTAIQLGDKDSRLLASKYWICELAEIVALRNSDHNILKNFFSSAVDHIRPPYGKKIVPLPRRCVFVGTTNDNKYLVDETGNRRYLAVAVEYTEDGLAALRRDREQLLAEAVAAYRAGEQWHFDFSEISLIEAEAEERVVESSEKVKIRAWWFGMSKAERPKSFTMLEAYELAFGKDMDVNVRSGTFMKIGHVLAKMKFKRRRDATGARSWRYYATDELLNAERESRRGGLLLLPGGKSDEKKGD